MTNLHLIIQLTPVADRRVVQCSTINRGTSTYLDIVTHNHREHLRYLYVVSSVSVELKTESICAKNGVRMDYAALPDLNIMVHNDVRLNPRVFANLCAFTDVTASTNMGTIFYSCT